MTTPRLFNQGDFCDCCVARRKARYQRVIMVNNLITGILEPRLQLLCGTHAKHPRLPWYTRYYNGQGEIVPFKAETK